jgi:glycosyltransferase involved in cell wall biosynthesis
MYKDKIISVVIPAYKEEKLISKAIDSCPQYVDKILVINDCSPDRTKEMVEASAKRNPKVILINHEVNQGVGGAIASGYKWSRDNNVDVAVVMAGDAQMDPNDMPALLDAVIDDGVDYAKGNRLFVDDVRKKMPAFRYYGNQLLSLMTKTASGYWHVFDSQCGYTAINKRALKRINWDKMYKRYGMPNDLLVRLNVENMRVRDIPINPIYGIGEKSGIKVRNLVFTLSMLLFKRFLWRLKEKYVVRNFHPLVLFYGIGWLFGVLTVALSARLLYFWIAYEQLPRINALGAFFAFTSYSLFTLFAMWFDMDQNKDLK